MRSILVLSFVVLAASISLLGCDASSLSSSSAGRGEEDHDSCGFCCGSHKQVKKPVEEPATDGGQNAVTAEKADPIVEALAKLSPEDRELAKRQKVCPVTEEPLGSMGTPVKLTVKGQTVFICCAGCEESLKSDPGLCPSPPALTSEGRGEERRENQ